MLGFIKEKVMSQSNSTIGGFVYAGLVLAGIVLAYKYGSVEVPAKEVFVEDYSSNNDNSTTNNTEEEVIEVEATVIDS